MFQSFTVKNFRCFRELTLGPLERINLIAGKNNTGKTALLEAIHLFCNPNDCLLLITINEIRGIKDPGKDQAAIGSWLFANHNPSRDIELSRVEDQGTKQTLKITLADSLSARMILPEQERREVERLNPSAVEINGPYFILRYQQDEGEWLYSVGLSNRVGSGMTWVQAQIRHPIKSTFLSATNVSTEKDAEEFGEIEGAKRQEDILPALRILEPRLEKLSLVPLAGQLVIHGDIGLPRLVPLPLMGEGMRRVLSLVLAIANAPGGVVLIDEIENGLHHSVLVPVWQAIAEAARRADVQVFAATHSYECIQAAQQAFQPQGAGVLRLFRLDRIQDQIRVADYDQEILNYAIEMTHEVR